ncbi:stage II sporulation protein P [Bacillus sp. FJAT-42376]|uniref:stage II sporulation protein P n=1 Tax=Bacillus sp. FJAT-42376 TaxID=2014076 RepID=UPI000F4F16A2|nr:stage II sporulation protein P [Bacillus sp. FJAT-42376]AZB43686.1 stage II sporulation protein P [Bacillus sp. FJAT-42376]
MKRINSAPILAISGTSIKKLLFSAFLGLVFIFVLSGVLTSLKPQYRPASESLHSLADGIAGEAFVYLMGSENHYFTQVLPEESKPADWSSMFLRLAASINLNDPRSLLGRELPGFSLYDSEIIVAGEGGNYSTIIPFESAPPEEVQLQAREASIEELRKASAKTEGTAEPPVNTTGDKQVVYIYSTHNTESYLPLFKNPSKNSDDAFHKSANVTLVGKMLADELKAQGVGTRVEQKDIQSLLKEKNMKYSQSYTAARPVVQEAMASGKDLAYLIDIHRDSRRHAQTTVTIKGKAYAQLVFVVGGKNANREKNIELAKKLHTQLAKKYPGLSKGVTLKIKNSNGLFNQDLSGNSILLEVGGVDNNIEELRNSTKAVADVFSEYYWQAEKVQGDTKGKTEKK